MTVELPVGHTFTIVFEPLEHGEDELNQENEVDKLLEFLEFFLFEDEEVKGEKLDDKMRQNKGRRDRAMDEEVVGFAGKGGEVNEDE